MALWKRCSPQCPGKPGRDETPGAIRAKLAHLVNQNKFHGARTLRFTFNEQALKFCLNFKLKLRLDLVPLGANPRELRYQGAVSFGQYFKVPKGRIGLFGCRTRVLHAISG